MESKTSPKSKIHTCYDEWADVGELIDEKSPSKSNEDEIEDMSEQERK